MGPIKSAKPVGLGTINKQKDVGQLEERERTRKDTMGDIVPYPHVNVIHEPLDC